MSPERKSFFSGDMRKARASQDDSIELTDMGSKSSPSEDKTIAERLLREAVDDTSLRCKIEDTLSNHGISFQEVTFEMGDGACDKNGIPITHVRVRGITGHVPRSTWFKAEGEIAEAFLKRGWGYSRLI
ncbi:hypothetical protein SI65_09985 [Aspergillus cristatus]|uniref:Uncharacterized protein n=1 Tax=Aspergillus cristatus TaxID=573508 RepID=A0A1E3B109_ASPCR|nr:hypothetical protein SI65_09985 [Aspergillus cristatus]